MKKCMQRVKILALTAGISVYAIGGCSAAQEFRSAVGDSLHTGLTTIATGLLDGLFAVFEPDATATN